MPSGPVTRAPELTTDRLFLRAHRKSDLADSFAMWSNPDVVRYIGGRISTEEEVWARLLRYSGHWPIMGYGYWLVTERESGRFVGEVGFADFRREMTPSIAGTPESGWALVPWAHGRGYASEALAAGLRWLDGELGKVRTVCIIDAGNKPSIRVAEKAGYRFLTETKLKGEPTQLFER